MAVFMVGILLLLAMAAHSDASFCVCNSGLSDSVLQKNIDYACANGADCTAINQNGACYNPNTVKDHCNFAVNSYYQKKGQIPGSCDFQGSASVTQTAPSASSGCTIPSGPSNGGGSTNPTTPTTGTPPSTPVGGGTSGSTPVGGTPSTGGSTPVGGTPSTGSSTPVGGTPSTGSSTPVGGTPNTGVGVGGGTLPGSVSPAIGLGPAGGFSNTDGSDSVKLSSGGSSTMFYACVFLHIYFISSMSK